MNYMQYLNSRHNIAHYGIPQRSGRYPWGSGGDAYQRSGDFIATIKGMKDKGMSEAQIAKGLGLTTTQLRTQKSLAIAERRGLDAATAKGLRERGLSLREIAKEMGFENDSSVRSLLNIDSEARMNAAAETAKFLKDQVNKKGMIDVGTGVELELNISKEKLNQALYMLELEGYNTYGGGVPQVTNVGRQTNIKVLTPPGTPHKDIYQFDKIHSIRDYTSKDNGETFNTFKYPSSIDSKRVHVRFAEDGGTLKDGTIEIRRGVKDLDLGGSMYAQVRIMVDGKKYLKGMAHYSDDMPKGADIVFNTNKPSSKGKLGAMKDIKDDPENPFGALIKAGGQSYYTDSNGKKQMSPINKTREEGDWSEWSDKLSAQFLSKQNMNLINRQLGKSRNEMISELDKINSLTNPTVKKRILASFADDADATAVDLQAASLPRQKYQVILPINSLKDNEIYAPNYKHGEVVSAVRYPHGGTFEIPTLIVNNKNKEGRKVLGNALDAVGINSKVAGQLSGADFDGDTAMILPHGKGYKITSTPPLKGLEGFDPQMAYPYREGMKVMRDTGRQMGSITNLIADMTIKGANNDELARAVRHSMVVIDAEKHKLNYKQSESDNNIANLKATYQTGGASTLITRAKSTEYIVKRTGSGRIDPKTGKMIYKQEPQYYTDKTGKQQLRTEKSTKMAETDDARSLSSGTPKEEAYASYANTMKALANQARKDILNAGKQTRSPKAAIDYAKEVSSLEAKLNVSLKNKPKERQAQTIANAVVKAKREANPNMTNEELKKIKQDALNKARINVGASRNPIKITEKEWEAIQKGAISENKLTQILNNTDIDNIRELATPKQKTVVSAAKSNRARSLLDKGYTISEVAEAIGVSTKTIQSLMRE